MISLPPHSDPMLRFQVHPHEKTEKEAGGGGVVGFTHSCLRIKEYLIGRFSGGVVDYVPEKDGFYVGFKGEYV